MAIGLGLMFGFRLPLNFDTPYQARNMIEFWKRWHMTMTRFFMMYLYSPLALSLSRFGLSHFRYVGVIFIITVAVPTLMSFLLSGLWHGAGWTFIAFGAVNGVGLICNHAWKSMKATRLPFAVGWALTIMTVLISFVYFRAESINIAHNMLSAMFSPSAFILPNWLESVANSLGLPWRTLSMAMPNWAKTYDQLVPSWRLAGVATFMDFLAVGSLDQPQTFLYFQF